MSNYLTVEDLRDHRMYEDVLAELNIAPEEAAQFFPHPDSPVISQEEFNRIVRRKAPVKAPSSGLDI